MTDLIGKDPNQVPVNLDLGEMAYQNRTIDIDNFIIGGVRGLELLIKSWGPTYWFDYDDSTTRNSQYIYSKGNRTAVLTGTDYNELTINGRVYWRGTSAAGRYYGGVGNSWGYQTSYFFVSAITANSFNSSSSPGMYYIDANSPYRVSVSADSFGANISNGELSHYCGGTSGYDDGNNLVGRRYGSSLHGDYTVHAVAGSIQNWNDPRGGENIRFCTLNTGTLGENLFNNGTASGSHTATEIYWGNRHSLDRGSQNRAYAEMILFNGQYLNQDQYLILEHYFKMKYGGITGRSR